MSELDDLLTQARKADPADRIDLRDAIAAHGGQAIDAMREWLGDPRLAAFAIRVLESIGRVPTERAAALAALATADRTALPPWVIGDLDQALAGLGGTRAQVRPEGAHRARVERSAGDSVSTNRWGALWTEAEYERLFGTHPPEGERPTEREIKELATELGRTVDAVRWQWGDGASYVQGGSASTTSQTLMAWLDRRGRNK